MKNEKSPQVRLAEQAIEAYIKDHKIIEPPKEPSQELKEAAGVFVSIKKNHALRGCIGTFAPTTPNIATEIIRNAIEAATRDPRFSPITKDELADLQISVDVLTSPLKVSSIKELNQKKYGVIVKAKNDMRRGLLLPDLEGVDSPEYQIEICRQKGGIGEDEEVELYRFEVKRYH